MLQRVFLGSLAVAAVLFACDDDSTSGNPGLVDPSGFDGGSGASRGTDAGGANQVDAGGPGTAGTTFHNTCPNGYSNAPTYVAGGVPGMTAIYGVATKAGGTDGYLGRILLDGHDVELTDYSFNGSFAVGNGALYTLDSDPASTPQEVLFAAKKIADAPGVTAISASAGGGIVFGAAGLKMFVFEGSPTKTTTEIGTVNADGCSGVLDFWSASSGAPFYELVALLDCGTSRKRVDLTWSKNTGIVQSDSAPPEVVVTGDARSYGSNEQAVGSKVYHYAAGAFTFVRDVDPCVGAIRGGGQ